LDGEISAIIADEIVPGSQNGFDNSGRRGSINWQNVDPSDNATKTVIDYLANRYASASDVVTSIELVNEPMGWSLNMNQVKQYYYDGWGTIRTHNPDTAVVIHDAFQNINSWNGFMNGASGLNNVILDTHIYQIFSDAEVAMSPSQHVSTACGQAGNLRSTDKWTIVGEWTGAQTDCAQWLNGKGIGARYDGSYSGSSRVGSCDGKYQGTVAGLSSDDKKNIRSLIEAQLDAYAAHTGWIFWTWKAESAPEWNMQALIAGGLFPQPLNDRQYPGQCG
jgi:glucan 1,3-beta-glucosidase